MKPTSAALGMALALLQPVLAAFGPAFRSSVTSSAWIEEAYATLIVGGTPSPVTGDVALWTGMLTDKNDFIQAIAEHSSPTGG
jgi:hypothetical protein